MVKSRGCIDFSSLSPVNSVSPHLSLCSLCIENHFVGTRTVFAPRLLDCCFLRKRASTVLPLLFIGDYIRWGFSGPIRSVRNFLTARFGCSPTKIRTVLVDGAELAVVPVIAWKNGQKT